MFLLIYFENLFLTGSKTRRIIHKCVCVYPGETFFFKCFDLDNYFFVLERAHAHDGLLGKKFKSDVGKFVLELDIRNRM